MQGDVREAVSRHRWWIILTVVVMFGYSVSKDMAMREKAADAFNEAESALLDGSGPVGGVSQVIGIGLARNKILSFWGRWQREALTEGA